MAAVAALCSCSNNEVMEAPESLQTPIAFGTYVGNSVNGRAAVIDQTALETGTNASINGTVTDLTTGFGVFGYYTGQSPWATYATGSPQPNFMYNQNVTYSASNWSYTPVKYWPNNTSDKVSFFAYAPYSAMSGDNNIQIATAETMTAPTFTFTVNNTVKNQTDLVTAAVINQSKASNPITVSDKVKFDFEHRLARIGFKAQTDVDQVPGTANAIDAKTTITIDEVQLVGDFFKTGTVDLATGVITGNGQQDALLIPSGASIPDDEKTLAAVGNGFSLKSPSNFAENELNSTRSSIDELNAKDSYIMIIPQNIDADQTVKSFKIRVIYTVTTNDGKLPTGVAGSTDASGHSKIQNVITSSPMTQNFEAGKAYTFNLRIGMTSVKFDAGIDDDWTVNNEENVNVPANAQNN